MCYVYRLTDKQTGKRYIGSRYAQGSIPEELGVKYFTSSSTVSKLYRANPNRFEKQIIVTGDRNYVIRVEKSLLDFYNCMNSENFYNRTNNKSIHPDDAAKGSKRAHSKKDAKGRSIISLKAGRSNVESGWAFKLGEMGKRSGKLPKMASEAGKKGGKIGGKIGSLVTNKMRYLCSVCNLISTPAGMKSHQRSSKHSGKTVL